jgi:hypothetical protein
MDNQKCDRHPSAWAKARLLLPSLGTLYWCGHCAAAFEQVYDGEFVMAYETVTV